ncbi:MAG: hypothetical protein KDH18_25720 [Rhodoferax sp.]|nr:hypothetical protein [Rhodoferax sp.]MCB2031807.1 hypothetical protein [Rhodoferax sp.]MCB2042992.1 hypothetical protein [Rhodoferax sp.]
MHIHVHADKIRRMVQLRTRLDPLADFELWYWTTLTAGTNIWNAVLHLAGITREERAFSTIPGVHVVPQADGSYRRELRGPGDVSHVGWPPIPGDMPEHVQRLEQALHALEEHRDPCLRGERKPTQQIVDACEQAFARAHAVFEQAIREKTR